jgi:regulator of extracellular matrix RemA (YlzA/DUF370 family)
VAQEAKATNQVADAAIRRLAVAVAVVDVEAVVVPAIESRMGNAQAGGTSSKSIRSKSG